MSLVRGASSCDARDPPQPADHLAMPLTRAQRNAAAEDASADAPAASSSQAPARRAFGAVDNQRKGKRKAAAKKEPAREVRDRVRATSRAPALFFLARARSRAAFEPLALNGTIARLSARTAPQKTLRRP